MEVREQIRLANFVLKKQGYLLYLKNCFEDKVIDYVKKCKKPTLLIFWQDGSDVHTKAVENGKFLNELEPMMSKLVKRKCKIMEFTLDQYIEKEYVHLDC